MTSPEGEVIDFIFYSNVTSSSGDVILIGNEVIEFSRVFHSMIKLTLGHPGGGWVPPLAFYPVTFQLFQS